MANVEESKVKDDAETHVKEKIDLDTILVNEIGQFGKFQFKTLGLAVIIAIFGAWGATEYVFTTARILLVHHFGDAHDVDHILEAAALEEECVIPECDGPEPEWSPYWLANAVPASGDAFDNCQRFANSSAVSRVVESATCPSTLFDRDTVQACEEYVYENTHSVAYDYGLGCEEWKRSLIGTVRTFGTLTALPITGYVSDRFGRRVSLTLNAFNTAWLGVVRYWADTYVGFMISEFAEATFGSGGFSTVYILFMELVGPKYRVAAGAVINTSFATGQVLMGLIAWGVPNWRNFTLALYIPQLLTIFYFWIISESVRWYMSKGRFEESEAVLKKIAKVNGKQLSEKSLELLRVSAEEEEKKKKLDEELRSREPLLIVQVFRSKPVLLRCCTSPIWWITTTFIYYGLSINAVNMSGNRYLNFIAVAAVEIPGFWTSVFLLGKIGRKPVLIGAFWVCAACQITYIFLPAGNYAASLTVYLIAKYCIAVVMTAVYVYTAELYPTKYRHTLFAFSSMMGRIGSMLAPLTPAIGAQWFAELPFVLFAAFALLSGSLIFLLPETLGATLPDTFEQAAELGVKKNKK